MKISTKGRYGLRVMTELALQAGRGPVLVGALAQAQDLPPKYLHVLLGTLRTAGFVRAVRGPNGGYELARDAAAITVYEVVAALEGDLSPVNCVGDPTCCPRAETCAARDIWCELADAVRETLGRHTLKSLADRQREKAAGAAGWTI